MGIKGRADTDAKKAEIIGRVLRAWEQVPALRLGQFLDNATALTRGPSVFNAEDEDLARRCEGYVDSIGKRDSTQGKEG